VPKGRARSRREPGALTATPGPLAHRRPGRRRGAAIRPRHLTHKPHDRGVRLPSRPQALSPPHPSAGLYVRLHRARHKRQPLGGASASASTALDPCGLGVHTYAINQRMATTTSHMPIRRTPVRRSMMSDPAPAPPNELVRTHASFIRRDNGRLRPTTRVATKAHTNDATIATPIAHQASPDIDSWCHSPAAGVTATAGTTRYLNRPPKSGLNTRSGRAYARLRGTGPRPPGKACWVASFP
jgi:hypothetical protein